MVMQIMDIEARLGDVAKRSKNASRQAVTVQKVQNLQESEVSKPQVSTSVPVNPIGGKPPGTN